MESATTRYERTVDGDSITYQVLGDGPIDLVDTPGFISNVETFGSEPRIAAFYNRLASFSRLILFDKREIGLSDPLPRPQPLEERFRDVGTVMDAGGRRRVTVLERSAFRGALAEPRIRGAGPGLVDPATLRGDDRVNDA